MKTAIALIATLLIAAPAFAQNVHKCVDANGKVSFQQTECPNQDKKIEIQADDTAANSGTLTPDGLDPHARGRYATTKTDPCQNKELLTTPDGKKYYLNEKNQYVECPATSESGNSRNTNSAASGTPITTYSKPVSGASKTAKSPQWSPSHKTRESSGCSSASLQTGPNGGKYYIKSDGSKVYCGTDNTSKTTWPSSPGTYGSSSSSRTWHTGPRGGEYYYNSKGNKVYRKKK